MYHFVKLDNESNYFIPVIHDFRTDYSPVYTGILIRIEINPDSNLPTERELANPNSNPDWTRSHEIIPDYEPDTNRIRIPV